jgi:hypothetical protein
VAYRDENEALRSRIAELERQLSLSEGLVQRLLGKDPRSKKTSRPDVIVGEVVHRVDETSLEVWLDDAGLDAIQRAVEVRLGHAIQREGRELRGSRARLAALAEHREGAFGLGTNEQGTWLRLETDLRRLPVLIALGPVLGALTSLPLVLWQMDRFHHFEPGMSLSVTMPVIALLMILGTVVTRGIAKRLARRAGEEHDGTWATLLELTREHARPKARVEIEGEGEEAVAERKAERSV